MEQASVYYPSVDHDGIEMYSTSDSYAGLEILRIELPEDGTFIHLLQAMKSAARYAAVHIHREYEPCEYDCTGQWFTRSLERVHRELAGHVLTVVYSHRMSCDV